MAGATSIDLLFAVQFDYSLYVVPELLGAHREIALASWRARLELPQGRDPAGNLALMPPVSAPPRFGDHLPDGWGIRPEDQSLAEVEAVLIVVPVLAALDFELSRNEIGGEGVRATTEEVGSWFESFARWLWVLTAQPLDPVNPDSKVLHRRSSNMIVGARTATESSLSASGSPTIVVTVDTGGHPWSERLADARVLDLATQRAGATPAPLTLELLANARMAARRGDRRRALIDAGTAAEGALTQALNLPPNHQQTLGGLVRTAVRQGVAVPADSQSALVDPRNDAAHRGQISPGTNVGRALEIAEAIVALAETDLIAVSSLQSASRPQRHDLVFIQAGTREDPDAPGSE